tara:strand:- start:10 stop:345 length:336 start_codon:yes stop_codon:yes gene_type:complete
MFKIEDSIGDIIYISFRNVERFKDIGVTSPSGHFFIRGIDNLGIWLEHPGIILAKTEDAEGKPLPINEVVKEKVNANFLVTWDNINSLMHYPDREGFDFPSEFNIDIGFKK